MIILTNSITDSYLKQSLWRGEWGNFPAAILLRPWQSALSFALRVFPLTKRSVLCSHF